MPTPQRLDAVFFRLESGSEPVREWLKSLPKDERKAIGEDIAYVQFKWPIGKPHVDHLDEEPSGRLGRRWPIVSRGHSSRSRAGRWCCFKGSSRRHSRHRMTISSWRKNALRSGNVAKRNPRTGSRFDDFLERGRHLRGSSGEGTYSKRALAEQLQESMQAAKLTKLDMAKKMATSRSQLDRVLDPSNVSVQLDTLIKAARALGKEIEIRIKRAPKKQAA